MEPLPHPPKRSRGIPVGAGHRQPIILLDKHSCTSRTMWERPLSNENRLKTRRPRAATLSSSGSLVPSPQGGTRQSEAEFTGKTDGDARKTLHLDQASPRVFRQGYHPSIFFGYILVPVRYFDASPILILANGTWPDTRNIESPRVSESTTRILNSAEADTLDSVPQCPPSPRKPPDK